MFHINCARIYLPFLSLPTACLVQKMPAWWVPQGPTHILQWHCWWMNYITALDTAVHILTVSCTVKNSREMNVLPSYFVIKSRYVKPKLSAKKPPSYLPKDTSLSTVSTPVPRMLSKDCPASEYNKSRTKVSCNTTGVLQGKKKKNNKLLQTNWKKLWLTEHHNVDLSEGRRSLENCQLTVCLDTEFSLSTSSKSGYSPIQVLF